MLLIYRLATYLSGLALLVCFELLFIFPDFWYLFFIGAAGIISALAVVLNQYKFNQQTIGFLIPPLVYCLSALAFLLFMENIYLEQIISLSAAVFSTLFFHNVFNFLHRANKYTPHTLENLSNYLNVISAFFIYASAFYLHLFANLRYRWLFPLLLIITGLLTWQGLWVNKIADWRNKYITLLFSLSFLELYWVLHYWPTSFLVGGIIMAGIYYILINLTRYHLLSSLNRQTAVRYILVGGVVLIITLGTAQWT